MHGSSACPPPVSRFLAPARAIRGSRDARAVWRAQALRPSIADTLATHGDRAAHGSRTLESSFRVWAPTGDQFLVIEVLPPPRDASRDDALPLDQTLYGDVPPRGVYRSLSPSSPLLLASSQHHRSKDDSSDLGAANFQPPCSWLPARFSSSEHSPTGERSAIFRRSVARALRSLLPWRVRREWTNPPSLRSRGRQRLSPRSGSSAQWARSPCARRLSRSGRR